MNTKPRPFDVVSSATLRDSDLLESMLDVLEQYRPRKYAELIQIGRGYQNRYGSNFGYISYLSDNGKWTQDLEDLSWFINEDLWDAMQDISPAGCSYSSHVGDGALFGFWPDEDLNLWE